MRARALSTCVRAPLCSLWARQRTWATRLYPYESKCSGVLAPVDPIQNAHCGRTAAGRRWVLTGYSRGTQASSVRQHSAAGGPPLPPTDGLFGGANKRTCAHAQQESGRPDRPNYLGHSCCIGVGHEVWTGHGGPVEVFAREHPCHSGRVGDASSMHARHDVRQGTRPSRQHSVQQHAAATCSINSPRSKRELYQRESTAAHRSRPPRHNPMTAEHFMGSRGKPIAARAGGQQEAPAAPRPLPAHSLPGSPPHTSWQSGGGRTWCGCEYVVGILVISIRPANKTSESARGAPYCEYKPHAKCERFSQYPTWRYPTITVVAILP